MQVDAGTSLTICALSLHASRYGFRDFVTEMRDASRGASPQLPLSAPHDGGARAALVAHSAAGWIARIYLGQCCFTLHHNVAGCWSDMALYAPFQTPSVTTSADYQASIPQAMSRWRTLPCAASGSMTSLLFFGCQLLRCCQSSRRQCDALWRQNVCGGGQGAHAGHPGHASHQHREHCHPQPHLCQHPLPAYPRAGRQVQRTITNQPA